MYEVCIEEILVEFFLCKFMDRAAGEVRKQMQSKTDKLSEITRRVPLNTSKEKTCVLKNNSPIKFDDETIKEVKEFEYTCNM